MSAQEAGADDGGHSKATKSKEHGAWPYISIVIVIYILYVCVVCGVFLLSHSGWL
jgi:hypothetical protein